MGISRLAERLHEKLGPGTWYPRPYDPAGYHGPRMVAIIDGPNLVYHLLEEYLRDKHDDEDVGRWLFNQAFLTSLVVQWLNRIVECIPVHKIYFDSALPAQKLQERIYRFEKACNTLIEARQACDQDLPSTEPSSYLNSRPRTGCFSKTSSIRGLRPPFLIPMVIEGLASSYYSSCVELVPGEADHFCAAEAQRLCELPRPTPFILSNDSDLLILPSGRLTQVVPLTSLKYLPDATIKYKRFMPAVVAEQLNLADLRVVARYMAAYPKVSLNAAAQEARHASKHAKELAARAFEHVDILSGILLSEGQKTVLQQTDPRIAELIYSTLTKQPSTPRFFLPILIDDVQKSSAHGLSSHIRNLAYLILLHETGHDTVVEHDRRGCAAGHSTLRLNPTDLEYVDEELLKLMKWFDYARVLFNNEGMPGSVGWPVLAMLYVMHYTRIATQQWPRIHELVGALTTEVPTSWAQAHLIAELHATLYSCRLLQSVVRFQLAGSPGSRAEKLIAVARWTKSIPGLDHLFQPISANLADTVARFLRTYYKQHKKYE